MNDLIQVLTDISDYKAHMDAADTEYAQMESLFAELAELLPDTSKWAGETRDKCENVNNLLEQYEQALRPIIESLAACLGGLTEDAGAFFADSRNAQKIRGL